MVDFEFTINGITIIHPDPSTTTYGIQLIGSLPGKFEAFPVSVFNNLSV
jgi:hypothetical protein